MDSQRIIVDPDIEVQYQSVISQLHDDLLAANMRANWAIDQIGKYVKEVDFLTQELYNERNIKGKRDDRWSQRTHGKEEAKQTH